MDADYQPRARCNESITVGEGVATKPLGTRDDVTVHFAQVTPHKQVIGFQRRNPRTDGQGLSDEDLNRNVTMHARSAGHPVWARRGYADDVR